MSFQDAFAGTNRLAVTEAGNPLGDGSYPELEIGEIKIVNGHTGQRFIVALHVTAPPSGDDPTAEGGDGDFSRQIDGPYREAGQKDVKAFVYAALGIPKTDLTFDFETTIRKVFGPEQILKGRKIKAVKWTKTTKNDRKMAVYRFEAVDGQASPVPAPASPPPLPGLPPAVPPLPAAFPPPGWMLHPNNVPGGPVYFYKGTEVLTEAALRARGG